MNDLSYLLAASVALAFILRTALPWWRRRRDRRLAALERSAARKLRPIPAAPPARRAPTPAPATIAPAPPSAPYRLISSPADARRGIVLMTVLGPCRALEPPQHP